VFKLGSEDLDEKAKEIFAKSVVDKSVIFGQSWASTNAPTESKPNIVTPPKIKNPYARKPHTAKYTKSTLEHTFSQPNPNSKYSSLTKYISNKLNNRNESKTHLKIQFVKWYPGNEDNKGYGTTLCVVFIEFVCDEIGYYKVMGPRFGWNPQKFVEAIHTCFEIPDLCPYLPELLEFKYGISKDPEADLDDYDKAWEVPLKSETDYSVHIPMLYIYMPIEWDKEAITNEAKRLLSNWSSEGGRYAYSSGFKAKFKTTLQPEYEKYGGGDFWKSFQHHLNNMEVKEVECLAEKVTDRTIKQIVNELFGLDEDPDNWPTSVISFAYEKNSEEKKCPLQQKQD